MNWILYLEKLAMVIPNDSVVNSISTRQSCVCMAVPYSIDDSGENQIQYSG